MAFKHTVTSAVADGADATLVRPSDWNADHGFAIPVSLGAYLANLNVGTAYGTTAESSGHGLVVFDWTGVTSIEVRIFMNKVGTGTVTYSLVENDSVTEIATHDVTVNGEQVVAFTVTTGIPTGVKAVRLRVKSTVSTDDPAYYGAAFLIRKGAAPSVTHLFVDGAANPSDATKIRPSDWNANHHHELNLSLGRNAALTNVGTEYDAILASKGLGLIWHDWTGVTSLDLEVYYNKNATGTISFQLWNVTDGVEIGVIGDAAATGIKFVTGTFTTGLPTGLKLVRLRAKSDTSTNDPVFYGATLRIRTGTSVGVKHAFQSAVAEDAAAGLISVNDWNEAHTFDFPESLGAHYALTNVGTAYDTHRGLGMTTRDWTGVESITMHVMFNKLGTGVLTWQLWNDTDSVEVGVIVDDTGTTGVKKLTGTFTTNLPTGVKRLRLRVQSTVSTDDPVMFGAGLVAQRITRTAA